MTPPAAPQDKPPPPPAAFDAPVELSTLLLKEDQQLLDAAARDLRCPVCLIDREGEIAAGPAPPGEVLQATPEAEPVLIEAAGCSYLCSAVFHDGDRLALIVAGPIVAGPRPGTTTTPTATSIAKGPPSHLGVARYVSRVAEVLLLSGLRRTLASRLHVASVEDAYFELQGKNQRLEQALARMQELDRIKANFLATVSHELRTPLTSVIGYSEMLMEGLAGPLNDEQREYLRTVMDKGEQLLQLITGILDISRMESSGIQLFRAAVDVYDLVGSVMSTITPQARRKHLRLSTHLPDGLPPIDGDRDKLRQVLLNLVGNAIKFTPEGGSIGLSARTSHKGPGPVSAPGPALARDSSEPEELILSVADSGIGIPTHLHEKIFDPFFQVDNSSTRQFEGTGLGLSIVRKFIEAHHGRVWLENQQDGGVIFYLALPIVMAAS